jgi:hypothetical protein
VSAVILTDDVHSSTAALSLTVALLLVAHVFKKAATGHGSSFHSSES